MLFNSYIFIFFFLPITLSLVFLAARVGQHKIALTVLIIASLFFYGWWNPFYLPLIIISVLFNFLLGRVIYKNRILLFIGLTFNLGLIAYFKYANFFVDNLNIALQSNIYLERIILPLAISFFTFQQIAFLVDSYRGNSEKYHFLHYCLFVTFFPQLIAGPIVQHKEIMPQFLKSSFLKASYKNLVIGASFFSLGLFKKIVFADSMAIYASATFDAAEAGAILTIFEAWLGSLAYTMQLYFDFSGYSDMALGLATIFGIKLPVNFFSPYKATNIADFWRRWHITLSRMIREYLWDPISLLMTRKAIISKYGVSMFFITTSLAPTIFVFFWIGLWHGAGWNFIIFGLLHGSYITAFNLWTQLKQRYFRLRIITNKIIATFLARTLTFLCVIWGWVFFRAETFDGAKSILSSMFGFNGISLSSSFERHIKLSEETLKNTGVVFDGMFSNGVMGNDPFFSIMAILFLISFCYVMPNCVQIFSKYQPFIHTYDFQSSNPALYKLILWRPTITWIMISSLIFTCAILALSNETEFLYFQF